MNHPLHIKDSTANPAPLGLLGFGMTTVLLNFHNAGMFEMNSMILAMGICYGGLAQIIAGVMEWTKNNTFAATAFISYGFFWLSLVILLLLPKLTLATAPNETAMGSYLAMWGLFTAVMFIGTLRLNHALQVVFGTLTVLFFLLAIGI
jgi:succinate-acetate transporter protein